VDSAYRPNGFGGEARRPDSGPELGWRQQDSSKLLWLQNQVETDEPSDAIANKCLAYFARFDSRAA
jgi:hypothetical protein